MLPCIIFFVSVAIRPTSSSVAIHVTQFALCFLRRVTVLLFFIAPVITFKLQDSDEPQEKVGENVNKKEQMYNLKIWQFLEITCQP